MFALNIYRVRCVIKNIIFIVWNYDSLEDGSSRVTTTENKIEPVSVQHKMSNIVKNLTIDPHRKSDENNTLSCYLKYKHLESNITSVTIGYIRSHHSEPHFGKLKFNGHEMLEIYKDPNSDSYCK